MKKALFALLLGLSCTGLARGAVSAPVELTPENMAERGFAFTVKVEADEGQIEVAVQFTNATPGVELHPLAGLEIVDAEGKTVVFCNLESEEQKSRNVSPSLLQGQPVQGLPLSFRFTTSESYLKTMKFWIGANELTSGGELYWFRPGNFVKAAGSE